MTAQKTASVTAVLGGVLWLLAALGVATGLCFAAGLVLLVVALLAGGYTTVAAAPVWLRLLVPVAVVALGWIVFASIDAAMHGITATGSQGDRLTLVVGAVLALVGGALGWLRVRAAAPSARPTGGHRASR